MLDDKKNNVKWADFHGETRDLDPGKPHQPRPRVLVECAAFPKKRRCATFSKTKAKSSRSCDMQYTKSLISSVVIYMIYFSIKYVRAVGPIKDYCFPYSPQHNICIKWLNIKTFKNTKTHTESSAFDIMTIWSKGINSSFFFYLYALAKKNGKALTSTIRYD